MKQKKIIRIIMIILAVLMLISFFAPLMGVFAENENRVVIAGFETGKLRESFETARGKIDQNLVTDIEVKSGVLSSDDILLFQGLSACERIELSGTTIDGGVLPDYIFSGRGALRYVALPSNVTRISNGAFSGCASLEEVIIPESVTVVGNRAFESCTGIAELDFKGAVTCFEECAFRGCSALKKIVINGAELPEMGNEAVADSVKIELTQAAPESSEASDEVSGSSEVLSESGDEESQPEVQAVAAAVSGKEKPSTGLTALAIAVCVVGAIALAALIIGILNRVEAGKKK